MKRRYIFIFLLALTACTTHKGFVDYKEIGVYASENAGNLKFEDVGPVSTDVSSFIWASCDTVAKEAVRELIDMAKVRGGNTVYNITFDSDRGRVSTPTCHKRWGWFTLWIVPGLGPWMTATSVDGIAAKLNKDSQTFNSIYIPKNADSSELAETFIMNSLYGR